MIKLYKLLTKKYLKKCVKVLYSLKKKQKCALIFYFFEKENTWLYYFFFLKYTIISMAINFLIK